MEKYARLEIEKTQVVLGLSSMLQSLPKHFISIEIHRYFSHCDTNEPRYLKSFGIKSFKSFSCSYSYSKTISYIIFLYFKSKFFKNRKFLSKMQSALLYVLSYQIRIFKSNLVIRSLVK